MHFISPGLLSVYFISQRTGTMSTFESYELLIKFPFDVLTALASVLCLHC